MDHRIEAVSTLHDDDVLAILSTGYGKILKHELMSLLKLRSIMQ